MKKFLIGCGVLFLIVVVCVVGCVTYAGVKMHRFGKAIQSAQVELEQVERDFPFAEPAPGTAMDADRFDDYLAVRRQAIDRVMEVKLLAAMVQSADTNQPPDVGLGDVFGMLGEIPKLMSSFARILRTQEMSAAEYAWHTRETFKAIGAGERTGDEEFSALWDELMISVNQAQQAINQQTDPNLRNINLQAQVNEAETASVPLGNIDLVRAHLDEFAEGPMMLVIEMVLLEAVRAKGLQGGAPAQRGRVVIPEPVPVE